MESFEITEGVEIIGQISEEGYTSVVYKGFSTKDLGYVRQNTPLAIKLFRQMPTGKAQLRFERELEIGCSLESEYLVKYYANGVYRTSLGQRPFIIMEYVEGQNLRTTLSSFSGTDEARDSYILGILFDVLSGLKILHGAGIIHRDIQPRNILVRKGKGILIDFGMSKYLIRESSTSIWEEIGSRRYWAPECIKPIINRWSYETDVFMVASCFVHIITGKYLFNDAVNYADFYEKLRMVTRGWGNIPEIQVFSELAKARSRQIFRSMLAPIQNERSTVVETLYHLLNKTTPQLEQIADNDNYPLSKFLWSIESEDELRIVIFLGQLYELPNKEISLRTLRSLAENTKLSESRVFFQFIYKLGLWGILRQVDEDGIYFHDYSERIVTNDNGLFAPCLVAWEISKIMIRPYSNWRKIQSSRLKISHRIEKGSCKFTHAGSFDHLTFQAKHYVIDPCDHESWQYRLAVQEKLFIPEVIFNVKLEHYSVHIEHM